MRCPDLEQVSDGISGGPQVAGTLRLGSLIQPDLAGTPQPNQSRGEVETMKGALFPCLDPGFFFFFWTGKSV